MKTAPRQSAAADGITLLRISLGIMWIAHALLKLWVITLARTATYFASVGLPSVLAYPVFAAELLGGLALTPIMMAAAVVHAGNGWVHTSLNGGWEYPVFLSVASVALWLIGDGALAAMRSTRFALR
ncbi:hypothetical protein CR152_22190 [Massilia violaceinigra]|uniref:DoxX family protein n=1 Tax=Massilia violaceinigra TaxID=2045208 RepID=A0A2D2DPM8_9BURK|nr:DoxX family membrane protein [Massilia violaceinigra]ATQ76925.1 hypothetical protein CR152_22190 [Massilia violaceinigra]